MFGIEMQSLKHKAAGHSCLKKQNTAVNKWRIGTASLMCLYERKSTVNFVSFKTCTSLSSLCQFLNADRKDIHEESQREGKRKKQRLG